MKIKTHDWHQAKGAAFEEFFGCEIPSHYGSAEQEYRVLRESVGVRDVSFFGKIEFSGKDQKKFLQGKLTNDVNLLSPGKGIYATALDIKGHIQADLKIYDLSERLLGVLQHYVKDHLMKFLDRYIISEDVRLKDVSDDYGMLQILGPQADALLKQKGIGEPPAELYSFHKVTFAGREVRLIRLGAGYALLCAAADTTPLLDSLDIQPIGVKAFDVFRVENGLPLIQLDFDQTNFPQEARLDSTLNFNKGCYLGQEVMARIDAQGHVNRFLKGIVLSTEAKPGDAVYKGEKEVGKLTSVTRSPKLDKFLAMGYVRREFSNEGEAVEIGSNRTTGIVRQLPV